MNTFLVSELEARLARGLFLLWPSSGAATSPGYAATLKPTRPAAFSMRSASCA
jgi:hypothetical protein